MKQKNLALILGGLIMLGFLWPDQSAAQQQFIQENVGMDCTFYFVGMDASVGLRAQLNRQGYTLDLKGTVGCRAGDPWGPVTRPGEFTYRLFPDPQTQIHFSTVVEQCYRMALIALNNPGRYGFKFITVSGSADLRGLNNDGFLLSLNQDATVNCELIRNNTGLQ